MHSAKENVLTLTQGNADLLALRKDSASKGWNVHQAFPGQSAKVSEPAPWGGWLFSPYFSSLGGEWELSLYCHRFLGPKVILINSWGKLGITYWEANLFV